MLWIPSVPSHALSTLIVPLTPSQAPSGPHCPPWPLLRPIWPSLPPSGPTSGAIGPSLFPLAPPQAPSGPHGPLGPCWAALQPIQRSPFPRTPSVRCIPCVRPSAFLVVILDSLRAPCGRCSPSARPSASLVVIPDSAFLLASARPDTHYSLSSTMSLRVSAAARCPPGCPPASWWPLSPWPGPARLPVRVRRGLLRPSCSRCGRRAGSCAPASPPPAPLPTPPGAPVPQRRAGAGRLCGNQSVTRSGTR